MLRRPRIARVAVVRVVAERAHRQLGHVEPAEIDAPRVQEPAHRGAVVWAGEVVPGAGATGGGPAADRAEILERERHAVERAAPLAAHRLGLETTRRHQRVLGVHRDERAQPAVQARDLVEAAARDLEGRELAVPDRGRDRGQATEIDHRAALAPGPGAGGGRSVSPGRAVLQSRHEARRLLGQGQLAGQPLDHTQEIRQLRLLEPVLAHGGSILLRRPRRSGPPRGQGAST